MTSKEVKMTPKDERLLVNALKAHKEGETISSEERDILRSLKG